MALTPITNAQALAQRPELERLGPSRLTEDSGSFKTMLTSQLGVSSHILGSKAGSPVSALANLPGMMERPGAKGLPRPAQANTRDQNLSHQVRQSIDFKAQSAQPIVAAAPRAGASGAGASGAGASGAVPAVARAADAGSALPGAAASTSAAAKAAASSARAQTQKSKAAADDLGHLPGPGSKGTLPLGFTKEEEDLMFAAAAAESKFLAAKRQSVQAGAPKDQAQPLEKNGALCAAYESGGSISAIGYDGKGGTSYGLYQIASGVGTMGKFLRFMEAKAPDLAARLTASGPANSGGRGGQMAQEWKRIAGEQPKRFEALQHEFIKDTHYTPALKSVTLSTGTDLSKRSQAVREVLWSTAVQHGPNGASEIFTQALDKLEAKGQTANDKALIEEVYSQRMAQFSGRSGRTRNAVSSRLTDEKESALAMLGAKQLG